MSYGRRSILDDLKFRFRYGNMVIKLIMVNVGIFLAYNIVYLIAWIAIGDPDFAKFEFDFIRYFAFPFEPSLIADRFWTPLTAIFFHKGFWHLLWNMLYIYWFGRIVGDLGGDRKVLPIYLFAGLLGVGISVLMHHVSPRFEVSPIHIGFGASGAALGLAVASATIAPDYMLRLLFIGGVRLKYIVLVLVAIDVLMIPSMSSGGTDHFAHLGGALGGFLYILLWRSGVDIAAPFERIGNWFAGLFKRRRKIKVRHSEKYTFTKKKRVEIRDTDQEKIDQILDKISESGYDSLSAQEKEFLFKQRKD